MLSENEGMLDAMLLDLMAFKLNNLGWCCEESIWHQWVQAA